MAIAAEPKRAARGVKIASRLPLVALPVVVGLLGHDLPPWVLMGALAVSIYAGLKWLTFAESPAARHAPSGRAAAWLLLWPGMDATRFLASVQRPARPPAVEWWAALTKTGFGLALMLAAAPFAARHSHLLAGWTGMIGIVFVLHFGLFHLLSLAWRRAGIDAVPIMQAPVRSASLAEFWGRRWNLAFRDVAHTFVFRPLLPGVGPGSATMAVFLASGLVHDLVISLPARAGWGLPTLYFLIQGSGLLVERSRRGRALGLGRGVVGRLFCAVVTVSPLFLLFHRPFVERVVLPLLTVLGALP